MEWISVKDRMPEKDKPVLTFDGTYFEVLEYWYDEDLKKIWMNPPNGPTDSVTHWMELPKPPEE